MKKQIRCWLVWMFVLVMAFSNVACAQNTGLAQGTGTESEGEYSACANGFGGDVVVTIQVKDDAIVGCTIQGDSETPGIGGRAVAELPERIIAAGGAVDGISEEQQ